MHNIKTDSLSTLRVLGRTRIYITIIIRFSLLEIAYLSAFLHTI